MDDKENTVTPRTLAETPVVPKKAKRSKLMVFLNTAPKSTAVYHLMGKGITSQTVGYNPQTSDETYINEDSGTTDVESYKPTIPTPQTAHPGDPVFDFVDGLRQNRATMDDARTDVVLVNAYLAPVSSGSYPAEKNVCSVQIDDFGGDGGAALAINYTINLIGDPVKGTFDPSTKTFTPTTPAT